MPPTSGMGSIHYPPYAPPPAYTYPQAPQGGDFDDPRFAPPGTAPGGTVTFAPPTQWGPAPAAMASGGADRSLAAFAAESAYRANLSAERLRADMLSLGCGIASDLALRASTTAASEDLSSTEDGPPATPRATQTTSVAFEAPPATPTAPRTRSQMHKENNETNLNGENGNSLISPNV